MALSRFYCCLPARNADARTPQAAAWGGLSELAKVVQECHNRLLVKMRQAVDVVLVFR